MGSSNLIKDSFKGVYKGVYRFFWVTAGTIGGSRDLVSTVTSTLTDVISRYKYSCLVYNPSCPSNSALGPGTALLGTSEPALVKDNVPRIGEALVSNVTGGCLHVGSRDCRGDASLNPQPPKRPKP